MTVANIALNAIGKAAVAYVRGLDVAPPKVRIDNTAVVEAFRARGGKIIHILPGANPYSDNPNRGVTVAFIQKGRRVELATAVQHVNDTFTKKIGTKTAIQHFDDGQTVFLPLRTGLTAVELVRSMMWAL